MDEKTTSELLGILSRIDSEKDLASYAEQDANTPHQSFSDYFNTLEKVKTQKRSDLIRRIGIERTYGYQLLNGTRGVSRDNAILFCRAAGLDLTDTQRLLEVTNLGILYAKNRRDTILIFCINKDLSVTDTEELIDRMGEPTLQKNS